jgi:hypothetical protein
VEEMIRGLGNGVAAGGTLFMVGHRPIDPMNGATTPAARQVQVPNQSAVAALDPGRWDLVVAEERPRRVAGTGVDAVIRARRKSEEWEALGLKSMAASNLPLKLTKSAASRPSSQLIGFNVRQREQNGRWSAPGRLARRLVGNSELS